MLDRLKKTLSIANSAYIEAIKILKGIGIFMAKIMWCVAPPLILFDPLSFFAIPIILYWWIFWVSYFWDDWITPDPKLRM